MTYIFHWDKGFTFTAEASDESQELKAINEALIEDAMREEMNLFNLELEQLNQRVQSININVSCN